MTVAEGNGLNLLGGKMVMAATLALMLFEDKSFVKVDVS